MHRAVAAAFLLALGPAAGTSAAAQSVFLWSGGGAGVPIGFFNEIAKTGYLLTGGVGVEIGTTGVFVEAEGFYGVNQHTREDIRTKLYVGFGSVGYSLLPGRRVSPYALAGAGVMSHQFDPKEMNSGDTKLAYTGAVGLGVAASRRVSVWVEGRYIGSGKTEGERTNLLPLTAGVLVSLGGRQ